LLPGLTALKSLGATQLVVNMVCGVTVRCDLVLLLRTDE
jgi:hypothetical protein